MPTVARPARTDATRANWLAKSREEADEIVTENSNEDKPMRVQMGKRRKKKRRRDSFGQSSPPTTVQVNQSKVAKMDIRRKFVVPLNCQKVLSEQNSTKTSLLYSICLFISLVNLAPLIGVYPTGTNALRAGGQDDQPAMRTTSTLMQNGSSASSSPSLYQATVRDSSSTALAIQMDAPPSQPASNSSQSPSQSVAVSRAGMSSNATQTLMQGGQLELPDQSQSMNLSAGLNAAGTKSHGAAATSHNSATKGHQHGQQAASRQQSAISSNSPAFNSRHLKQQQQASAGSGRNVAESAASTMTMASTATNTVSSVTSAAKQRHESSSPMGGGIGGGDNQMAADGAHSTRAFMSNSNQPLASSSPANPMSSGARDQLESVRTQHERQDDDLLAKMGGLKMAADAEPSRNQTAASSAVSGQSSSMMTGGGYNARTFQSNSPVTGQAPTSSGRQSIVMATQTSGHAHPQSTPRSKTSDNGNQQPSVSGWQTVSTSISADSPPARPTSSPQQAWRQRSMGQPRYLPPPPPPVGYNTHKPQRYQLDRFMQQQQQQDGAELEQGHLERPAAGYSYGSPSYTHMTHLSPPSKTAHLGQQKGASHKQQRQRQYQPVPPPDQLARSSSSSIAEQAGGNRLSSAELTPSQLPQFSSNVQYVQQQQLLTTGGYPAGLPHLSTAGTLANPCRPPLSQSVLQDHHQQQQQLQLATTNELLSVGASTTFADRVPSSVAKYVRAREGARLRSLFVFKVIRANSLTECELACSSASLQAGGNQHDSCNSFNYHAGYAAENCELSRYDLATLKLDDSSQFEQHSEFDFYARRPLSASMQLQQQPQQPTIVQQQQVGIGSTSPSTNPFQLDDCLDVSQSCSQEGMEFTLRTSEPFNGRIYTYGFYDSCYFDGDGSTTSMLRISRSNGFPRCGTQQIGDLMTNIVVVQFSEYVQTTRDKKYNLTCYFSGPGEAVVTSNYLDTKIDERNHPIQIEHLPPQNVVTSNVHLRVLYRGQPTNTIAVGDLLTFRLETSPAASGQLHKQSRAGHDSLASTGAGSSSQGPLMNEIFATNVIAKDPYSGRQVQLIDSRGCPVDATNVFPELQRTPDGALESEFYAFKIPDSNFLIFQATVRTCKSPCEPVICQSASGTPTTNIERPPTAALHHHQSSAGIKGGGSSSLGAYLMAPHQSSAPSWGRKRRRRRKRQSGAGADDGANQLDDNDDLIGGAGESVEHVIPVRLLAGQRDQHQSQGQGQGQEREFERPQVLTRVKRPDLSEAEEEVKEMFRVYLTRAEINKQLKRAASGGAEHQQRQAHQLRDRAGNLTAANRRVANSWKLDDDHDDAHYHDSANDEQKLTSVAPVSDQVCLTSLGYYVMLFALISLTLIVLSVLFVAIYIARKAKFHISDTLADSMF